MATYHNFMTNLPEIRGELPLLLSVFAGLLFPIFLWPRVGRGKPWALATLSLVLALGLAHDIMFRTRAEDAFITFRYALNLASGRGVVFNPGERVEGYSNFLFLLVLAGLKRYLGVDIEMAARALGVAASVVTIMLTYRLAHRMTGGNRHAGLLAALLVAASGTFAAWALSGMETPLFALLGVLVALCVVSQYWLRVGFLIALATMTRPDGVLFLLLVGFEAVFAQETMRQRLKSILGVSIPFLAVIVPWTLWRLRYYGHLVPNAIKAKEGMDPTYQAALGLVYIWGFLKANWPILFLFTVCSVFLHSLGPRRPSERATGPLGLFLLAYVVYVVLVGGDWMPAWRFLAPMVPLASCLLVGSWNPGRNSVRVSAASQMTVLTFGAVSALLFVTSLVSPNLVPAVRKWNLQVDGSSEIGAWFHDTLPASTLVAVFANGALSYHSQLPTIDLLGLTDEHIARFGERLRVGIPGHLAHDYAYVAGRRPAIIAFLGNRESQGFEAAPGRGYTTEALEPFYEPVSFWFPHSKNPLGQYVNLLILKSEKARVEDLLTRNTDVRVVDGVP